MSVTSFRRVFLSGLGRTYALMLAERGCAVIVNDLGGDAHGQKDGSRSMADKVCDEIKTKGGRAVPNYDSVEFGDRIVKTAIDNFGRIDIVINNAGILRDKSFLNMTDRDWDLIHLVHLRGAYSVTKAAWPYMRQQKFGRVIMTSSNSGIYGNFGQANYSAAKLGLIGLANTLAREGVKYNIKVNALVPTAGSRLTMTSMPQETVDILKPEFVTPLTVWLCHEDCPETGGVFEAGAGWFGQNQWYRSNGIVLRGLNTQPEDVRDNWERITDMTGAKHMSGIDDVTMTLINALSEVDGQTNGTESNNNPPEDFDGRINAAAAKASKLQPVFSSYTSRDVILYALGVGAPATDLQFVFEGSENFSVLPSYAVAHGLTGIDWSSVRGFQPDPTKILHGEQYLEQYEPFPTEGRIRTEARIADILDKGSGAVVLCDVTNYDENTGKKLAFGQYSVFQVGDGNFGGARTSSAERKAVPVPNRRPDAVIEQQMALNQAAIYRLGGGDLNPLHIDPQFASLMGFKKPIAHGLCSFGFSVRHILQHYGGNDVNSFRAVKVRFAKPVTPGQTLVTETWRDGNRIHFQTKVKETGVIALSSGYVDLHRVVTSTSSPVSNATPNMGAGDLESAVVFTELGKRLKDRPELVQKVKGVFLWVIKKNGKEVAKYTVDLKNGKGAIYDGAPKEGVKANTTLMLEDGDMVKLVTGKLNPQQAFMSGKLKLKGNIMLTQKLQALLGENAKL